ncbi:beta-lactamase superfamily domain-containing protein [Cytidiella melzeri]|nr:beta-lactamase superfamily domain-containing protein [Cytidiella melzeri]
MSSTATTGILRAITVSPPVEEVTSHESGDKPAHHVDGGFVNPWPSFRLKFNWTFPFRVGANQICNQPKVPANMASLIPVHAPNWGLGESPTAVKATWLGHACYLVELPAPEGAKRGARIIFDPALSHRCFSSEYLGPARITPVPCEIEDIPELDAIVLSHNHYDHTDTKSLQKLVKQHSPHVFAPLGNRPYLESCGISSTSIHILDWWGSNEVTVELPSTTDEKRTASFNVICTPCQHISGRSVTDRCKTLWASWAVEEILPKGSSRTDSKKVWFGGDTGYRTVFEGENEADVPTCPAFAEIGERIGPFDLAMIPIGAYHPQHFFSSVHASPMDSVRIFEDVKAKKALAMHWGTWLLTTEPIMEPPELLRKECHKSGIPEGDFDICGLGETRVF